ncbi:2-Hydroxyacid oxidase 2-like [Antedon mediterranea]|uniref:2-Hydroxyacid oxidase 2-like n=1 Tax=Antedon mediterranea TaxID=105859 RepID=UPI003AF76A85
MARPQQTKYASLEDFKKAAFSKIKGSYKGYIFGGCNEMTTMKDNVEAFRRYRFLPQVLRDVSNIDVRTTVLGQPVACPIGMSPTGFLKMAHEDGEKALAKASIPSNIVMILSIWSTNTIEDIVDVAPNGLYWMQIQLLKDKRITENIVRRAVAAGFKAIVVTVDQPIPKRKLTTKYDKQGLGIQLESHLRPINLKYIDTADIQVIDNQIDGTATWKDLRWLKSITSLPIVVKGILTGADAKRAVHNGADAILVSNHGGRQFDYLPATIDVLSEVVAAVEGSGVEVYMDGGVRRGTDVLKALARGARAVFIGRPLIWGLACNGHEGVSQVIDILKDEFSTAMAFMGCSTTKEIVSPMVVHERDIGSKL